MPMNIEAYDRQLSSGPFWALPQPDCIDPEVGRGISIVIRVIVWNTIVWSAVWAMW